MKTRIFEEEMPMNMIDVITRNARIYPDHTALVEVRPATKSRKAVSWAQFHDRINRLTNALTERGIKKNDRVFILGRNSINWLETYFAVIGTGAWAVPLNYRFYDENIQYCADVARPVAFLMDEEYAERIKDLYPRLPTVRNLICVGAFEGLEGIEDLIEKAPAGPMEIELKDDDPCALYFTSGTTGDPKPVLHVHKNLMCVALNEVTNERWEQHDSLLMMPPF